MDLRLTNEMNCDLDTFWSKIFFDPEYNRALYLEGMKFPAWEQIEQTDRGGTLVRRVQVTPPSEMPAVIEKFVGGSINYAETGTFDKASRVFRFEIVPNKMADRLELAGKIFAEASGDKRIRRIGEIHIKAKVFGIGGMIEGFMAKTMRDGYDAAARFTNDWIQKKGL